MLKKITRSTWYKENVEPLLSRISWFEYELLKRKSALSHWGWFKSRRMKSSVDSFGNQIPWYTYSFLDAFSDRIPGDLRVFEYGSGNSTKWWAERTDEVVSVEHHEGWYRNVMSEMPANVTLMFRQLDGGAYENAIIEAGGKFDLIILDGRERVACSKACLQALSDRGVIIWDNSERLRYGEGIKSLLKLGFRQLRYTGFIPIDFAPSETSIFYRDGNCFNI